MSPDSDTSPVLDVQADIRRFVGTNPDYYVAQFSRIQASGERVWSFNWAAAILGPFWAAARGVWGYFWLFAILDLFALVELGRGLWGDLGATMMAKASQLQNKASELLVEAQKAREAGDGPTAKTLQEGAENLIRGAEELLREAELAVSGGTTVLVTGLLAVVAVRAAMGFFANTTYEEQFTRWWTDRWRTNNLVPSGLKLGNMLFGVFLIAVINPLTLYRFTASNPDPRIKSLPIGSEYFATSATALDRWLDHTAEAYKGVFDGITALVHSFLLALELILVSTPWPVVMIFVFIVAWQTAGIRVAIFSLAALAYFGILGFWESAMATFSLIGTAAAFSIAMGIPLGIWFAKSARAYAIARPILDLMQTLPPFVYLVPIIAFFGTGRVPGVLATIIVAMPAVIRLTALGIMYVNEHVKEAARAFGASKRQLLVGVEIPLAAPSIMTGINQTILLCLSMVVIASLIGAKGLGQDVLSALQYVAKGEGILAGIAILFCAMILDRIVQGRFQIGGDKE